jgi:CBS domain-containing protein
MKSVAVIPVCELTDFEDEPTAVLATLGSLVREPAIVVELETPLAEVRHLLLSRRVPAIAVVDDDDNLRGLVTRTDVLALGDMADATACDAMSGFVFALPSEASIEQAAALMALEGVGQIVVTRHRGELAGMVSAVDIARHLAVEAGYLVG